MSRPKYPVGDASTYSLCYFGELDLLAKNPIPAQGIHIQFSHESKSCHGKTISFANTPTWLLPKKNANTGTKEHNISQNPN